MRGGIWSLEVSTHLVQTQGLYSVNTLVAIQRRTTGSKIAVNFAFCGMSVDTDHGAINIFHIGITPNRVADKEKV